MVNYISKIDKVLLDSVSTQQISKHNCIIFARDYVGLSRILKNSDIDVENIPFIGAMAMKLDNQQILRLAKMNEVNYIARQCKVFAQIDVSKDIMNAHYFYKDNIYGKDITVAVIDTGISPHLDFCLIKNRVIKFVDLINDVEEMYDDNGHGTFVASILAGNGISSGRRYAGLAPQCNIISIKAIEGNGETGVVNILKAMQWVYDNRLKYNIRVVCMSFGSSPLDRKDPLLTGAEVLWNSGVVVVAAAGNSGPDKGTIKSPGISPKILTVGGLDDCRVDDAYDSNNFKIAKFSSRGPAGYYYKPDCIAPAVDIVGASYDGGYTKMSGTSVATPMVAGLATLMISKNPLITPDQVKVRLIGNCHSVTNVRNDEGYGYISVRS